MNVKIVFPKAFSFAQVSSVLKISSTQYRKRLIEATGQDRLYLPLSKQVVFDLVWELCPTNQMLYIDENGERLALPEALHFRLNPYGFCELNERDISEELVYLSQNVRYSALIFSHQEEGRSQEEVDHLLHLLVSFVQREV